VPFDRQIPTSAALRVDRRSAVYRAEQEYVMESAKKRTRRSPSGDERKAIAYVDRTHLSESVHRTGSSPGGNAPPPRGAGMGT